MYAERHFAPLLTRITTSGKCRWPLSRLFFRNPDVWNSLRYHSKFCMRIKIATRRVTKSIRQTETCIVINKKAHGSVVILVKVRLDL